MNRTAAIFSACLLAWGGCVFAQSSRDDEPKKAPEDPFTGLDEKDMQKLGVVSYAPLTWAGNLRSEDIEKVLGAGRFLWMETEHFKICSNLATVAQPADSRARKVVKQELKELHRRDSSIPSSTSKFEPWLRTHLYALRAEQLYERFAAMAGIEDGEGDTATHLGQPKKFLLVMFQKKSDLVRYMDRFCGRESDFSGFHRHYDSNDFSVVLTAEGEDGPIDCESMYARFRFFMLQMFVDAAGGGAPWLSVRARPPLRARGALQRHQLRCACGRERRPEHSVPTGSAR